MESRYDPAEAVRSVDRWGARYGEDLALRVYTSRLLGREPALVLHGGGNTSVKSRATDLFGEATDVLLVKGSGADLATVEPRGFPACRLAPLRRCLERPTLSDDEMVAHLLAQRLDASSPTPSVEALLHAFLPGKFVEHTHADAVLAIVDQPDSAELTREVWGDQAVFVPYAMAGFALARRVVEAWKARRAGPGKAPSPTLMVLDKHGILTWGDTARDSYERMIEAVTRAEDFIRERVEETRLTLSAPPSLDVYAQIGPAVRGALAHASGKPWVLSWRTGGALLAFTERDDLDRVSQLGCATPDHVLRTRARPLVLDAGNTAEPVALRGRVEAALRAHADHYHDAFHRFTTARDVTRVPLDPWPRVLLFPGLGVLTVGRTRVEAEIVADLYEHTAAVIKAATALGAYRPADELDLFDVEYSSLEQAKLHRPVDGGARPLAEGPLERRIVLVTGAGSSVGLGVARALCAAGAHVLLTDRARDPLAAARQALDNQFPGRAHHVVADVSEGAEARRVVSVAAERFGGLDVVVSCAGAAPSGALHTRAGDQALRASLEGDLLGHQAVARAAAEVMLAQGTGGALLFTVSRGAASPGPDVAEAALVALMRQYAVDLAPYGIRANAVGSDRVRADLAGAPARTNPLRRETTIDDVARAFIYLATAEATTGCVLTVDGGNGAAFSR